MSVKEKNISKNIDCNMNDNDLKRSGEYIRLIENKLQGINADLRKLNSSIYSDPGKLSRLNYKSVQLAEDLTELKQAVKEAYIDALIIESELIKLKDEAELLETGVKEMIGKYYSNDK